MFVEIFRFSPSKKSLEEVYSGVFNNFGSIDDISLHQNFVLVISESERMLLIDWINNRRLYISQRDLDSVSIGLPVRDHPSDSF